MTFAHFCFLCPLKEEQFKQMPSVRILTRAVHVDGSAVGPTVGTIAPRTHRFLNHFHVLTQTVLTECWSVQSAFSTPPLLLAQVREHGGTQHPAAPRGGAQEWAPKPSMVNWPHSWYKFHWLVGLLVYIFVC